MCLIYSLYCFCVHSQFQWFFSRCLSAPFSVLHLWLCTRTAAHTRFYSNKTCNQREREKNKLNTSSVLKCQGNQSVTGTKGPGFVWDLFTCWWWTLDLFDLLHLSLFTLKLLKRSACSRNPLLVWRNTTFIGSAMTLKAEPVGGFFSPLFFFYSYCCSIYPVREINR